MVHWYNPFKELGTETSPRFESNGVQVKLFLTSINELNLGVLVACQAMPIVVFQNKKNP